MGGVTRSIRASIEREREVGRAGCEYARSWFFEFPCSGRCVQRGSLRRRCCASRAAVGTSRGRRHSCHHQRTQLDRASPRLSPVRPSHSGPGREHPTRPPNLSPAQDPDRNCYRNSTRTTQTATATPTDTQGSDRQARARRPRDQLRCRGDRCTCVAVVAPGCAARRSCASIPLLVRANRRRAWRADLTAAEVASDRSAQELLAELGQVHSAAELRGAWAVSEARVAAAEDQLTALAASGRDDAGTARALQPRDAVRQAGGGSAHWPNQAAQPTSRVQLAAVSIRTWLQLWDLHQPWVSRPHRIVSCTVICDRGHARLFRPITLVDACGCRWSLA